MKALDLAVIGTGRMGTNHVRVLSEHEEVNLTAICDADSASTEKIAGKYNINKQYSDYNKLISSEKLDAVVIATPTTFHYDIAKASINAGINTFIEKPMASSVNDCSEIIRLARGKKVKVFIGHIERYNPVILEVQKLLKENLIGQIYYIKTVRSGPFPKRLYGSKDGVVIDLAVHDLDLVAMLFGDIKSLYAHHIKAGSNGQDIYARVMYKTVNDVLGSSEFSWISPKKERSISVYGDKGIIIGNLLDQEVWYFENGDVNIDYSDNYYQNVVMGRVSEGKVIKYPIKRGEPLKNEYDFFINYIKDKSRYIDPDYGRKAVEYSLAVLESAENEKVVRF